MNVAESESYSIRYYALQDDELLRLWAEKDGLTELARQALSLELTRRNLLNNPDSFVRVAALESESRERLARFNHGQSRIIRRALVVTIPILFAVGLALIKLLMKLFRSH